MYNEGLIGGGFMTDIVSSLIDELGADMVLTGEDVSSRQAGFFARSGVQAKALVRPRTTADVSRALKFCYDNDQSVVAHGGLTGLVMSAVTAPDDVASSA